MRDAHDLQDAFVLGSPRSALGGDSCGWTPPPPSGGAETCDWKPPSHSASDWGTNGCGGNAPTSRVAPRPARDVSGPHADLHFYFDPVCPFAWMTSTWVRQVMAVRHYTVDWRFISLRLVNANVDYATHFPPEYEFTHTTGLRLLRVAARARAELGREAVDSLQRSFGRHVFEVPPWRSEAHRRATLGSPHHLVRVLADAGLPGELADALDDTSWDEELMTETMEALSLTGKDVGTPILHVDPPHGAAFFGPVISRRPSASQAAELWDHVLALARFPGFSELKRSLRERPQLSVLGVGPGEAGIQEDWHQGSRRQKK